MPKDSHRHLSRRERQIMDIIYQHEQASAAQVLEAMPDPPSYSAVRALLRILEEKGHLNHFESEGKYIFGPTRPRENAGLQALKRVVQTFYEGSLEKTVTALMDSADTQISPKQLKRLRALIGQTKQEGR